MYKMVEIRYTIYIYIYIERWSHYTICVENGCRMCASFVTPGRGKSVLFFAA